MKYTNEITIKNDQKCIIRNGTFEDGPEVSTFFTTTHGETDYLLSSPEESTRDDEKQSNYLKEITESDREGLYRMCKRSQLHPVETWRRCR